MNSKIIELFNDKTLVSRIQKRLPYLFRIAEKETSRAGNIGMQVGSLRENIIIALLIYRFGENNVKTDFPITASEVDVEVFGKPISIKTKTGKSLSGVKLSWTVDASSATEFLKHYRPSCDILYVQIVWNDIGGIYYIPKKAQDKLLNQLGVENYIKLPKPGTNPRGIEITKEALSRLVQDNETQIIEIDWQVKEIDYNPYKRWIDYWKEQ